MTTAEKLRAMEQDTAMRLEFVDFTEFRTLSNQPKLKMVASGMWEAYVTYYLHSKGGILNQEAHFANASFEALVDQVWTTHQEVRQGIIPAKKS